MRDWLALLPDRLAQRCAAAVRSYRLKLEARWFPTNVPTDGDTPDPGVG